VADFDVLSCKTWLGVAMANPWHLQENALSPKAFAKPALLQRDVIQSFVSCSCAYAWAGCMQTGGT